MGQGQVFNAYAVERAITCMSQSLWVRDRFLINNEYSSPEFLPVAIPLGHGQVFNISAESIYQVAEVAIPLGQGQVFNESLGYGITNMS